MQVGDIWTYDLRGLYTPGNPNHRIEHWLILDLMPGDVYSKLMGYNADYYNAKDMIVHYLYMETGAQSYKVFNRKEWSLKSGNIDLYGNPYYKKVV